jgi:hypothetical protein
MSALFEALCDFMGVTHCPTTAYRPQGNSENERSHQDLHNYISMYLDEANAGNWDMMLNLAAWVHNSAIHRTLRRSPLEILTGVKPRNISTFMPRGEKFSKRFPTEEHYDEWLEKYMGIRTADFARIREETRLAIAKAQAVTQQQLNRHAKIPEWQVGQKVWIKQHPLTFVGKKWSAKYKGPYVVESIVRPQVLKLSLEEDPNYKDIVHASYIRPLLSRATEEEEKVEAQKTPDKDQPVYGRIDPVIVSQGSEEEEKVDEEEQEFRTPESVRIGGENPNETFRSMDDPTFRSIEGTISTPKTQEKTPNFFQQATRKLQGLTPKKLFGSPKKAYEKPNSFDSQEMESVPNSPEIDDVDMANNKKSNSSRPSSRFLSWRPSPRSPGSNSDSNKSSPGNQNKSIGGDWSVKPFSFTRKVQGHQFVNVETPRFDFITSNQRDQIGTPRTVGSNRPTNQAEGSNSNTASRRGQESDPNLPSTNERKVLSGNRRPGRPTPFRPAAVFKEFRRKHFYRSPSQSPEPIEMDTQQDDSPPIVVGNDDDVGWEPMEESRVATPPRRSSRRPFQILTPSPTTDRERADQLKRPRVALGINPSMQGGVNSRYNLRKPRIVIPRVNLSPRSVPAVLARPIKQTRYALRSRALPMDRTIVARNLQARKKKAKVVKRQPTHKTSTDGYEQLPMTTKLPAYQSARSAARINPLQRPSRNAKQLAKQRLADTDW